MLVGVLTELAVGALCIVLGSVLWKKQEVSLVHEYHYKNVKKDDEPKKELLAISNCRDAKNKQFWLIHYVNKVTVPPAEPVNIEELSNELDALLNS